MKYNFNSREELEQFIQNELVNTAEVMQILNCSRQNVFDLIKRGKLKPVKETSKERLFIKSDILVRVKPIED
jgi:predicted DNA-binding transcriptional regulator AlpA